MVPKVMCYKTHESKFRHYFRFRLPRRTSSLRGRSQLGRFLLVIWRRRQIFLSGINCLQTTRFIVSVRRCSVAIYCTGCTSHLKPTVLQNQILWITNSEADICIPAAGRIKTAARLYLKKFNNVICWCSSFVGSYLQIMSSRNLVF